MKGILALDQGTTSSRALFVDQKGAIHKTIAQSFKQHFPQSGWVEHDPKEILQTQLEVAKAIAEQSQFEIEAIGITNQRETTVVWDRTTGEPIYNAIVWQDRRTAPFCKQLKEKKLEEWIQKKTGLLLDPYFSAPKIKWILDNVEGAQQKADKGELAFGTIDTWLIWHLTKGKIHLTDHTNASRTLLYNIVSKKWDEELLELFGIPESLLPQVASSSEVYGSTDPEIFGKEIPISGCAGDQQAALFGQCCFEKGLAKNTYGTGCFLLMNVGDKPVFSKKHLLTTIGLSYQGQIQYALEGSVFIAGAAIKWLKEGLGLIQNAQEMDLLANSVADSQGVCFVPALTGLGAPHWDPDVQGAIFGLTRGSTKAHLARATLEAIAIQTADLIEAMCTDHRFLLKELKVDGGVAHSQFLMQLQADLLGIPIVRPPLVEVTALGAAFLAGLAIGFWKDLDEIKNLQNKVDKFTPKPNQETLQELTERWHLALAATKRFKNG